MPLHHLQDSALSTRKPQTSPPSKLVNPNKPFTKDPISALPPFLATAALTIREALKNHTAPHIPPNSPINTPLSTTQETANPTLTAPQPAHLKHDSLIEDDWKTSYWHEHPDEAAMYRKRVVYPNDAAWHAGFRDFPVFLRFYGLRVTEREEAEEGRRMLREWGYEVAVEGDRGGRGVWPM